MADNTLAFDPDAAIAALTRADPVLGALIKRAGPYQPGRRAGGDVFHSPGPIAVSRDPAPKAILSQDKAQRAPCSRAT